MVKKRLIIDIIPLTRITLARQQFFSYEYDKEIPAGSLVSIPLFKRNVEGIVIDTRSDFHRLGNIHPVRYRKAVIRSGELFNGVKLKKVIEILGDSFLTAEQIKLAKFISEYYFCSLGVVLKFFIPKRMKARASNQQSVTDNQRERDFKLTQEQIVAIDEIAKNSKLRAKSYYLFGPASSGKTEIYIESIKRLNKNEQALVLVPELTLTPQAIERYGQHFGKENIAVLTSKISKGKFYQYWQGIKSGEIKIIIGTRTAIMAPFKNLKLIVIDEEQDMSFKQWEMSPRYDTRRVAQEMTKIYGAKLVLGSATPSVESYHEAIKGKYKLLTLSGLEGYKFPDIQVVDLKRERNQSPISKDLQSSIKNTLKNKLQTILFINRQGMSAFSICSKCKTVLRCPQCERALVYGSGGIYGCIQCNYKTGVLVECSKCKNPVFKNIGLGTQKVEREIVKLFPEAIIKRVDFEAMKKTGEQEKLFKEFSEGKIDILIGTQMITKGWDLPKVGLVGIIDADSLLELPDFKTNERAFQNIVQAAGRTSRLKSKFTGKVIIQTYNPENVVIKVAAKMDFKQFYEKEIMDREALNYPPFGKIIKLIFQDINHEKVDKETMNVYREIKEATNNIKKYKLSEPFDPLVAKVRGRFRKQMVIKLINSAEINSSLHKILSKLGNGWIIDVDPVSMM